jgi:hypothetical protein
MIRFLTTSLRRRELHPRSRKFPPQTHNFRPATTGRHPHHPDNQGAEMTSTKHTTIPTRISQCLAATALMAAIAIWTAAIAGATRDGYNRCIINGGYIDECCINNNGDPIIDAEDGYTVGCWYFTDEKPEAENVPQPPGQTTTPPVLQNPPAQPSNPLISVPRGPNSGTLAP